MRKTLIYVVNLLVCLGLVGAVWAGKPAGKKTKEKEIPVTVTFRDDTSMHFLELEDGSLSMMTLPDLIKSDGTKTYSDGKAGVEAFLGAGDGQLHLRTDKSQRELSLNFGLDASWSGNVCTDARFTSITDTGVDSGGDCRTVANLLTFNEWVEELGGLVSQERTILNLLAMPVPSTAFGSVTIRFPSELKNKINLLRFGVNEQGSPVTVIRTAADTWEIEAVEPVDPLDLTQGTKFSVAFLLEGGVGPPKEGLFTVTGFGPLPFHITIVCDVASQCPKPKQ